MKVLLLLACCTMLLSAAETPDPATTSEAGRGTPVAAAKEGTYRLEWLGELDNTTLIVVGSPVGSRNLAMVTTSNADGDILVKYPALAFLDNHGVMHVDGRGTPLCEPHEDGYIPDSFAIKKDGTVQIIDDNDTRSEGKIISK